MNNKGSLSIEALISVFITLLLMLSLIGIINTFYVNEVINHALYQSVIEMSSNNICTQYGNNDFSVQDKTINLFSNKKLYGNLKYEIDKNLSDFKYDSNYDLKNKEGSFQVNYSFEILNYVIPIKKTIEYKSFLHKRIKIKNINDEIIYVTKTGEKYHKNGCFYLRKSKIEMKLMDAISEGYTPCSRCYDTKKVKLQ
ncbi:hypothetical protein QUF55_01100 [Clostridiaceae bacterium HSG29]|nr:hypothetical protein [Clostridiaceae bacterium HSG29]